MTQPLDEAIDQLQKVWNFLQEPIFSLKDSKVSVTSLFFSVVVVVLTVKVARALGRLANRSLSRREVDSGVRDSIERFVRYAVITVGVLFALDNLGISLNSLAAVGAVLMVGIGFGLQNVTQNFVSGIILLLERPIKVGDIVKAGSTSGRVVDIRVRSTIIETRDEVTIIVPNSKLVSEEVINDSYSGRRIRQHVRVGVDYSSDVDQVKSILCKVASEHPQVLAEPAPRAIFEDFGDSSLNFDLRFWTSSLWEVDLTSSDIRTRIIAELRSAGIEIPFPQRDVHIKTSNSGKELS